MGGAAHQPGGSPEGPRSCLCRGSGKDTVGSCRRGAQALLGGSVRAASALRCWLVVNVERPGAQPFLSRRGSDCRCWRSVLPSAVVLVPSWPEWPWGRRVGSWAGSEAAVPGNQGATGRPSHCVLEQLSWAVRGIHAFHCACCSRGRRVRAASPQRGVGGWVLNRWLPVNLP